MKIMKILIEKYWKMSLIFEFSIWKLVYVAINENLCKKTVYPFCRTFFTNQGKNEDEDNKYGKMSQIFEFFISKLVM